MKKVAFFPFLMLVLLSCNNSMQGKNTNSSGDINIYLEESFKPLFETSIYTFEGQYPLATVNAHYVTENDAIEAFFSGKTSTICITRDFTDEEKKSLLSKYNIEVRSTQLAIDAVALIVNPENTDTLMTVERLKNIIQGKDSLWTSTNKRINVVFDNKNSANFNAIRKLADVDKMPDNVFAVNSNEEVINYVKENRNALGIIGVNWISDEDDPATLDFRDGLTIVSVAKNEGEDYFKPYQAYIYEGYHDNKSYPLVREVWMITKAGRTTLDAGFVNFMTGEKGQLIILKSSLLPANMQARMLNIRTE
ncbi:MAG: substrate-binding domain-containing protein [Crocinitomicaceae bacterium]|nr:substrate-binding domain-containing protein [Crocinitomicaceae bacterium]